MKIFGIGLSRTGTTSLNTALEILGYKAIHWPASEQIIHDICHHNFKWSILEEYDALTDIHGAAFYQQFDKEYPGSKFILTTRNEKDWLRSMKNHASRLSTENLNTFINGGKLETHARMTFIMLLIVFKGFIYDEDKLRKIYQTHTCEVREYFAHKNNFLEINIGDDWNKLCEFLDKPTPIQPYPWENKYPSPEGSVLG